MLRILLVDADGNSHDGLSERLGRHGHGVERVDSGRAALAAFERADLVLLDLDLPDLDGVEVCRRIREAGDTPVITFTASGARLDGVLGLQAGADDSLVKPYEFRELVARMNAVLRRSVRRLPTARPVTHGRLQVDPRSRQVRIGGRLVRLTRKEFDVLHLLASQPGTVVSRKELMSTVWADDWATSSRTVDTHVRTLRMKLGDGGWIETVRGVGYRLGAEAADLGAEPGRTG